MSFLGLLPEKFLGIDIGTSSIKMVELSSWAGRKKLENYGEISASVLYKKPFRTADKSSLILSDKDIARAIKAVTEEAGIKSKHVAFSIPDFSTFFTTFELPAMSLEEVPQAVRAEARRHVPLPLGEVALDWQIIQPIRSKTEKIKILLVTVPNEVINQYKGIATSLGFKLLALEAEIFGLIRASLEASEKRTISLIDIGARSTTCSIIDNGALRISHSFDISGNNLTERVSKGLTVEYEAARVLRNKYGILSTGGGIKESNIKEILIPLVDIIIGEIDGVFKKYNTTEGKSVEKIILCGGTAFLPGLLEYFQNHFPKKEVEISNPFSKIFFSPILDQTLQNLGPSYAIALGMALRGFE